MKEFKDYSKFDYKHITAFRIMPMTSEDEKETIDSFKRNFFLKKLPAQGGKYFFKKKGMDTKKDALIFFKYDGYLIALAKYTGKLEYEIPFENIYKGHIQFDLDSVAIFDKINQEEIYDIGIRKLTNLGKAEFGGHNANVSLKLKVTEDDYNRLSQLLKKKSIEFYSSSIA